jgi:hypothetical protein
LWRAIYRFHEITLKMPLPIFIELEERLQWRNAASQTRAY